MSPDRGRYRFRVLTADDAEQFRRLRIEALETSEDVLAATLEEVEAESLESIRDAIERRTRDGGFSLGAFSSHSDLVGMLNVGRLPLKRRRHIGILWGLFVSAAHRGQDLASTLLQEAIARCREIEEISQLHIEVVSSNTRAFDLYRKLGFEPYGTQPRAVQSSDGFQDYELLALFLE